MDFFLCEAGRFTAVRLRAWEARDEKETSGRVLSFGSGAIMREFCEAPAPRHERRDAAVHAVSVPALARRLRRSRNFCGFLA
jgi:hypothetical protein